MSSLLVFRSSPFNKTDTHTHLSGSRQAYAQSHSAGYLHTLFHQSQHRGYYTIQRRGMSQFRRLVPKEMFDGIFNSSIRAMQVSHSQVADSLLQLVALKSQIRSILNSQPLKTTTQSHASLSVSDHDLDFFTTVANSSLFLGDLIPGKRERLVKLLSRFDPGTAPVMTYHHNIDMNHHLARSLP